MTQMGARIAELVARLAAVERERAEILDEIEGDCRAAPGNLHRRCVTGASSRTPLVWLFLIVK